VFSIDQQQHAAIHDTADWVAMTPTNIQYATQSGPILLINGVVNPLFQPQSDSRKIRNGVGVINPNQVVLIMSETPVNFFEFAQIFARLSCRQALYLDGSISSLYEAANHQIIERDTLGVLIGVLPRDLKDTP
jgi:uncharacterized protein YigE (DUF2233 family)